MSFRQTDFSKGIILEKSVTDVKRTLLFDAQTSGGLLIALPKHYADQLLAGLHKSGISEAVCIGEVVNAGTGIITVK